MPASVDIWRHSPTGSSKETPEWTVPKTRLDTLLVERGLVASRDRARALILAGDVRVNGAVADKAGTAVARDAEVTLTTPDHPYVGRGGLKLAHALTVFDIDVTGRIGLDIGASTGGFTDVLLQHGALRVVALDVGHSQLDWKLRSDSRVITIERVNARNLAPQDLPDEARLFGIVTVDVSFISLRHILPVVPPLMAPGADVVALVKPQFEARRDEVGKGGIIRDDAVRTRVVEEVAAAADTVGMTRVAVVESPIAGVEGNRELLMHLRRK
jgi:23S rRNA (cytidine1920-2'-O)/16S rRNA (cytidine1409-2'-O)-methyltransferase